MSLTDYRHECTLTYLHGLRFGTALAVLSISSKGPKVKLPFLWFAIGRHRYDSGLQPDLRPARVAMAHRILIVDDSAAIRQGLRSSIERQKGLQVCGEAENGENAVAKVKELTPDLVILDLQMPVMNGLDAARRIAQIAPQLPMLMFTMYSNEYLVTEARAAGIKDVFSKSTGVSDGLISAIQEALGSNIERRVPQD